jgi:hypothetical protein
MERPVMAKPKRNDEPAKIDSEVLRVARIVAAYRRISLAEYLSETLRDVVLTDHAQEIRKEQETKTPERAPRKPKESK